MVIAKVDNKQDLLVFTGKYKKNKISFFKMEYLKKKFPKLNSKINVHQIMHGYVTKDHISLLNIGAKYAIDYNIKSKKITNVTFDRSTVGVISGADNYYYEVMAMTIEDTFQVSKQTPGAKHSKKILFLCGNKKKVHSSTKKCKFLVINWISGFVLNKMVYLIGVTHVYVFSEEVFTKKKSSKFSTIKKSKLFKCQKKLKSSGE